MSKAELITEITARAQLIKAEITETLYALLK